MKPGLGLVLVVMLGISGGSSAQVDPNDAANKPAEIEPLAPGSLLLDLAQAGSRLVAVGERGHVLLDRVRRSNVRARINSHHDVSYARLGADVTQLTACGANRE